MFKEGEFNLKGGRFLKKTWEDRIIFKRYSWYKDLSLNLDILLGEIKKDSNFFTWVSPSNEEKLKNCERLFVSLVYYPTKHKDFYKLISKKLDKKGLVEVKMTRVAENFKMHPDLDQFFHHNYINRFFCSEFKKNIEFNLQFPGFKNIQIKI